MGTVFSKLCSSFCLPKRERERAKSLSGMPSLIIQRSQLQNINIIEDDDDEYSLVLERDFEIKGSRSGGDAKEVIMNEYDKILI